MSLKKLLNKAADMLTLRSTEVSRLRLVPSDDYRQMREIYA